MYLLQDENIFLSRNEREEKRNLREDLLPVEEIQDGKSEEVEGELNLEEKERKMIDQLGSDDEEDYNIILQDEDET